MAFILPFFGMIGGAATGGGLAAAGTAGALGTVYTGTALAVGAAATAGAGYAANRMMDARTQGKRMSKDARDMATGEYLKGEARSKEIADLAAKAASDESESAERIRRIRTRRTKTVLTGGKSLATATSAKSLLGE